MGSEGDSGLQFDKAELAGGAAAQAQCVVCQQLIGEEYFEVNGVLVCVPCKDRLVSELQGGSGLTRFSRAAVLGTLAAAVGAAAWYAIVKLTGYEIGLVAIGIGILVGWAVRRGADARGGWQYQALAMVLTYSAMVAYYVPFIVDGMRQNADESAASAPAVDDDAGGEAASLPVATAESAGGPGAMIAAAVVVLAIAFAAPFLAGFENFIGILILGFALYEAWKLNRRLNIVVSGPHKLSARG